MKTYVQGGYYHLYNRGVEKRKIFLDERDYKVFLHFLKRYLQPQDKDEISWVLGRITSLVEEIDLLAYCLMPNHFHLLVKQKTIEGIKKLMGRMGTCYGMYFNKEQKRVGSLFQSVYKAVLIENDEQLLHVSRYIHQNPLGLKEHHFPKLVDYPYSSYGEYLGIRKTKWVKPEEILAFFRSARRIGDTDCVSYQSFVEGFKGDSSELAFKSFYLEG